MHDVDFLKGYTDAPMLVRTDTLQFLDPRDVVADYKFPDFSKSYSGRVQSLKPEQVAAARGDDGLGPEQEAGGPAPSGAGGLALSEQWHRRRPHRDLPREAAQWTRSRRDAGLADVLGALPGLRPGHRPSDLPDAEGSPGPVGAGFRLDQARRNS